MASEEKNREVLTRFVRQYAPHLERCIEPLLGHRRWVEAIAITKIETQFCTIGHGPHPKNNCGNISSSLPGRPNGRFKTYLNQCDSLEDLAMLLETNRYKELTVTDMNGLYCINETVENYGGKCPNWTETTMKYINIIRSMY